jgi:hypothetical protein
MWRRAPGCLLVVVWVSVRSVILIPNQRAKKLTNARRSAAEAAAAYPLHARGTLLVAGPARVRRRRILEEARQTCCCFIGGLVYAN